jgi:hypothetical protein
MVAFWGGLRHDLKFPLSPYAIPSFPHDFGGNPVALLFISALPRKTASHWIPAKIMRE